MNALKSIFSWLGRFLEKATTVMLNLGTAFVLLIIRTLMIVLFFIGAFFHYKFSITQDDLFNSYQSACFVGGALGFLVFGLSLTALSPYFNYHPNFYEFFIAFAIGTSIGGYSFYRKYISES